MLTYRFSGGHSQDHLAEVDETQDGAWSERVARKHDLFGFETVPEEF